MMRVRVKIGLVGKVRGIMACVLLLISLGLSSCPTQCQRQLPSTHDDRVVLVSVSTEK